MISGILKKLKPQLDNPVSYYLEIGQQRFCLNEVLGKKIHLHFQGEKICLNCRKQIAKTVHQGYCYPCSQRLACCDLCLLKPELCHFHLGTCRQPQWGQQHCFIPHYIYLANTSGLKVGITRQTHFPGRFMDQGAVSVLPIFKVRSRRQAGALEVILAKTFSDKTNWRGMLKGQPLEIDLKNAQKTAFKIITEFLTKQQKIEAQTIDYLESEILNIRYPILAFPEKIEALNFDKTPEISGVLQGIKGQYLLLDSGVLNIRKFCGYCVSFAT